MIWPAHTFGFGYSLILDAEVERLHAEIRELRAAAEQLRALLATYDKKETPMNKQPKFHIYRDQHHDWRWRLVAANGRKISDSAEGYTSKAGARRAVDTVIATVMAIAFNGKAWPSLLAEIAAATHETEEL